MASCGIDTGTLAGFGPAAVAQLQKTFGVVAHSETLLAPAQRAPQAGR
jgi:hypothetical protein